MNNMKQWQQDISNVVDKNSLDIKNLKDNTEVGKLTARIDNIEAKDREQDVQLSNHGGQLENLFNKINTDVADTKTEINNTIEQLRLNTNNSITALQTSTDRALDTIKQNTTDSLNSLKTSIDRNIELLKSNTADRITALQTSIDRHTEELDNVVRSVNGVNADENGNVTISSLIPNQIIQSPVPLTDANLHLLDGALLSGDGAYADYVAMMGSLHDADPTANCWTTESDWQTSVTTYGECGKFVYDSENNTLRLPKLTSFVQATNSANELGSLVEAGLPNITGKFTTHNHNPITTGAFSADGTNGRGLGYAETIPVYIINMDASKSSAIYGNSPTVQPQAIKYYFYIVVGTFSKTDIQINIDNVMTDLNGKADKDLSNVPNSKGILVESYVNGASWYRKYSDGWCEQGSLYHRGDTLGWHTINLLIPFVNTNYSIQENRIINGYSKNGDGDPDAIEILSNSSFRIGNDDGGDMSFNWVARGYTR